LCYDYRAATELQREVAIHSKLLHNNIIRLMGIVFEPGNYGVILEYATHGDLWYFIRRFYPVCHMLLMLMVIMIMIVIITTITTTRTLIIVQALADMFHSALYCHSNETHATIANLPNSA